MRLVVIGGVAAGMTAAARARRIDRSLEIVVLEKGEIVSYAACGIPYYLDGHVRSIRDLIAATPEEFERRGIEVRTRAEAVKILHSRREVALAGGERLHYDKLIIATGARPDLRGIEGAAGPNVFTLSTIEEARRLKAFLESGKARSASVVGGGYIGLEAAEVLRAYGLRVTLYTDRDYLLRGGDPSLSDLIARHLGSSGVEVVFQKRIQTVAEVGGDLVILATGLAPNVELAAEAGVEIGRTGAIRTDERAETSLLGVYAAGDCAEVKHLVTGAPVWVPLGTNANKMGRVAGANAAGARERFPGIAGTSIVRVCGLGVAVTGLLEAEARQAGFQPVSARITAYNKARYFLGRPLTVCLVADRATRRILGGWAAGDLGAETRINVIAAAIHGRISLEEFAYLDLAYSPPYAPVWDPVLVAAQQLEKKL